MYVVKIPKKKKATKHMKTKIKQKKNVGGKPMQNRILNGRTAKDCGRALALLFLQGNEGKVYR